MNINQKMIDLPQSQRQKIDILLRKSEGLFTDDLERIWYMMDMVWDELDCDNKHLDWEKMAQFYDHPIWLLNGLFIEQHDLSMQHRNSISDWVANQNEISQVLDYGGGFGTLARLIANKKPSLLIDIYEPHPSEYAKEKIIKYENIKLINKFNKKYDVIISTDVLEHVPEPLKLFYEMIENVKDNGYLIIANCFYPVIKCHLPCTFHLRYTFNLFAKYMGLEVIGQLEGSHATLFRKKRKVSVNWEFIKLMEINSKIIFPFLELSKRILKPIYRLLFKQK